MQFSASVKAINGNKHLRGILLILGIGCGFFALSKESSAAPDAQSAALNNSNGEILAARLEQIEQEIINLRTTTTGVLKQLHESRLALAVLHLRIATQNHFPFSPELELVRQLAANKFEALGNTLTGLNPYAPTGVALVAELRDSFGLILLPKLETLVSGSSDQGWANWAWGWMNWAVIPFGNSEAVLNPRQQILQAVTEKLTEDNLSAAVQELEQLDGPAATIVARWIKEAKARLTVDAAFNSLGEIAVTLLGHSGL